MSSPETHATPDRQIPAKLPADVIDSMAAWASWHGHTVRREYAIAVGIHLRQLYAAELATDRGRAQACAEGLDPQAERSRILSELDRLKAAAYAPPTPSAPSVSGRPE